MMIGRHSIVIGVLGTAAAGGHASAQSPIKWDLHVETGVIHPITLRYKEFAEEAKKATNGKLDIVVRPAGELPFRATEVVKVAGDGQVQLAEAHRGFISVLWLSTTMRGWFDMESPMRDYLAPGHGQH